jgi:hypothetical protein
MPFACFGYLQPGLTPSKNQGKTDSYTVIFSTEIEK